MLKIGNWKQEEKIRKSRTQRRRTDAMPVEKTNSGVSKNQSKVSMPVEVNSEERKLQPDRFETVEDP